jgi:hypothetical protein
MQSMTFKDFMECKYVGANEKLYVIKDSDGIVQYIGISNCNIWNRWFSGYNSHFYGYPDNLMSTSRISEAIRDKMPDSLGWSILLFTKKDCIEYCYEFIKVDFAEFPVSKMTKKEICDNWDMEDFEETIIDMMRPKLNIIHNRRQWAT